MIDGACHRSVAVADMGMQQRRREDEEPSLMDEPKRNGDNRKNRIDYVASSESSMTSSSVSGGTVVLHVEDGDGIGDGEDDGTSSSPALSSHSPSSTGQGNNGEENEEDTSSKFCERGREWRPYGGDMEALGFALDSVPRGAAVMGSAVFVGTALLHLANEAAGCPPPTVEVQVEVEEVECTNRVYGMRPSSLLTTIQFVVSVTVALSMPLIGAVIDHTSHRRTVGLWSAVTLTLLIFCQIFISSRTWFIVAIVQVLAAVAYCVHSTAAFAYLPEISSTDKDRQVKYYGSFTVVQFVSTMLFLALIVATATLSGIDEDDAVATARLSQGVVFVLSSIFFGVAWTGGRMFGDRPASSRVPPGRSLVTAGFVKLFDTGRMIRRSFPAVGWTLLAVSLSESAVASFVTIAITFVTERLHFSATQNGIAILVLLGSTVPGSLLGTAVTKNFNPVRSVQFCLALWIATTAVASAVLAPGSTSSATYAFAVGWGVATGWYFPAERALYCTIIPPENNAELMGTYLCACGVLGWLPPLIFTVLNENGVDMRVGLASLILYFGASWIVYGCLVGDYDVAVESAKRGVVASVEVGGDGKHHVGADGVAGASSSASSCEEAEEGERRVGHGCSCCG